MARLRRLLCSLGLALVSLAVLAGMAAAGPAPDEPTRRVLLISTGSRLSPGFSIVDQEMLKALRSIESIRVETYAENLDIVRFPAERSQRIFSEYLAARYAEQPPDLVVLVFVGALGMTAKSLTQVFPATPILAVGFTEEELRPDQLGKLISGFAERTDAHGTLDLMLRLHPGLHRIVVIGGTGNGDRQKLERVRAAAAGFTNRVAVEFWDNHTIADLRRRVTVLPPDTAILYLPIFRDAAGQTVISADVGRWIGQSASVPVYVMVDQSFGSGAVGGMMSTVEAFGKRAGGHARRILTGTAPESAPFEVRSDSVPMFDWRALQRWNISEDALPSGSVVRFRPHSPWREYGWYIAAALLIIALQTATIAAFVLERRYRRRIDAQRERDQLQLQQQGKELAHVGRVSLMGELAASLAHELSQPLTAIFANASAALLSLRQGNPEESRQALGQLLHDQNRAAEVVRHMRRFVRKEAAAEYTVVNLADVVSDVVALVRSDAAAQRVEVICDIDPRMQAVLGDRVELQQVLLNLLLNALDAMRDATSARTISIAARTRDGMSCVAVSDRGHGLAADGDQRVFEPFYTTKPEGLGMGLAICRAIVRAHGGNLWAVNNEEGGATFCFTVPVAKA